MTSISRKILPKLYAFKLEFHRKFCSHNFLNISDVAVQAYLKNLLVEHEQLCTKAQRTHEESKRLFEIKPIINVYKQRNDLNDNIEELSKGQDDGNMKEVLKTELLAYKKRMIDVDRELQSILLEPQLKEGTVLLKVTPGAGDQEAMLFAREMFEMYKAYAEYKDWDIQIILYEKSENEGIRKASMFVDGVGASELMKLEAGVHRVHRIPNTEKGIHIHTSTVSVVVLSKPSTIEGNITDLDLIIETKQTSGEGAKPVDNYVCITHIPTGIVVESQEEVTAMQELQTRLWKKEKQEELLNREGEFQADTIYINEEVRTYDYPENKVVDHREGDGISHNLLEFMEDGVSFRLEQMQTNLLRISWRHSFIEKINQFAEKMNLKTADTH